MNTPNESGVDGTSWGVFAIIGAIIFAWLKKASPRPAINGMMRFAFGPVVEEHLAPLHEEIMQTRKEVVETRGDVSHMRRVIDAMPGSDDALAKIKAQDERWKHEQII